MPIDDRNGPVWQELFDLEHRMRRLEDDFIQRAAAAELERARRAESRDRFRWVLPTVLSAISTAALILSLHLL